MTFYSKKTDAKSYVGPEGTQKAVTGLYGSVVENQYASDRNAIMYIADNKSKRYVAFKAFLKSFKFNVKPKINLNESLYLINPFISSGQTLFSYKISLEVPSYNSEEGFKNLAKMQELFRYIATINSHENFVKNGFVDFDKARRSTLYLSNLINLGDEIVYPSDDLDPINLILDNGITGVIKSIEFKPSLDDGFFESGNFVFTDVEGESRDLLSSNGFAAKKYDLDLELFMSTPQGEVGDYWPFGMKFISRPEDPQAATAEEKARGSNTGTSGTNENNSMKPSTPVNNKGEGPPSVDGPPPDE